MNTRWKCCQEMETSKLHIGTNTDALLDFQFWFRVDLDALSEKHRVHTNLRVGSCGVQQQVRQLCTRNRVTITHTSVNESNEPTCPFISFH